MSRACEASRDGSSVATVPFASLRATADEGPLQIVGKTGVPAHVTHYAFGQLATAVGAPGGYLRDLPAPLAAHEAAIAMSSNVIRLDGPLGA